MFITNNDLNDIVQKFLNLTYQNRSYFIQNLKRINGRRNTKTLQIPICKTIKFIIQSVFNL